MLSRYSGTHTAGAEAEISTLEARRRRNSLVPISTLPPELIIKIQTHIVEDTFNAIGEDDLPTPPFHTHWTPVAQFCALWRNVALACPSLWTYVPMDNLNWFKASVGRSGGLLLRIDTWRGQARLTEYNKVFGYLVANMDRVRSLRVRATSVASLFERLRNVPAPQLESLHYEGDDFVSSQLFSSPQSPIQEDIMPNLCTLQLVLRYKGGWNHLLPSQLPTVTHLAIKSGGEDDHWDLLNRCAAVRSLSIEYAGNQPHPQAKKRPIVLPKLLSLHICGTPWALPCFLVLPSLQHVDMQVSSEPDANFFSCLSEWLGGYPGPSPSPSPPTRGHKRLDHLTLALCSRKMAVLSAQDSSGATLVTMSFSQRYTIAAYYASLFERCAWLAGTLFLGIRSIDVEDPAGWPAEWLQSLFYALRDHVQVNTVRIRGVSAFLGFLSHPQSSHMREEGGGGGGSSSWRRKKWKKGVDENENASSREVCISVCVCEECEEMRVESYPGLNVLVLDELGEGIWAGVGHLECWRVFERWLRERRGRGLKAEVVRLVWGADRLSSQ
ncbi:hypothetical protein AX16_009390 [Volvariella volvacea WC 439]|nr:hypothetical protein AX16_009390 [Volvariella volvacea WC 439]